MNKRIYIPGIIMLMALLASGCGFQVVNGSGKIADETRTVSSFSSVSLVGIGDVYLTQGESESVRIEAEDNLIQYFDTSVQENTLRIGIKDQYLGTTLRPTRPVKFYVSLPKIDAVTVAGSGNILAGSVRTDVFKISVLGSGKVTADDVTATNLEINLAGSGDVSLGKVTATDLKLTIAGSGDLMVNTLAADKINSSSTGSGNITLSGKVTEQTIVILGSGDYRAGSLNSKTASVRVTGSGSSQVSASSSLTVNILGSGDVAYSGSPKTNITIAGSGKVTQVSQ
jgi:hypothetical protein